MWKETSVVAQYEMERLLCVSWLCRPGVADGCENLGGSDRLQSSTLPSHTLAAALPGLAVCVGIHPALWLCCRAAAATRCRVWSKGEKIGVGCSTEAEVS